MYVNALKDKKAFDKKLEFEVKLLAHTGSDAWVEKTIMDAHKCLMQDTPPTSAPECEYCAYRTAAHDALGK